VYIWKSEKLFCKPLSKSIASTLLPSNEDVNDWRYPILHVNKIESSVSSKSVKWTIQYATQKQFSSIIFLPPNNTSKLLYAIFKYVSARIDMEMLPSAHIASLKWGLLGTTTCWPKLLLRTFEL